MVPFVIKFKESYVKVEEFNKITIVFFIMSTVELWTSTHQVMWDPGYSVDYLSYFMLGYVIRKKAKTEKRNFKAGLLLAAGILILACFGYIRYIQLLNGVEQLLSTSCFLPTVVSVLIFIGFSKLNFKKNVTKLSKLTFGVYLTHAGIWDVVQRFVTAEMDNKVVLPLMILIVFVISVEAAIIYQKLWSSIEAKWGISDRVCRLLCI